MSIAKAKVPYGGRKEWENNNFLYFCFFICIARGYEVKETVYGLLLSLSRSCGMLMLRPCNVRHEKND